MTIAFQGEVEHGDSTGNHGTIGPGDVQWMTAARGIIHEEFHSTSFTKRGGTFEMVQLWVNLPAEHKMIPPRYQPILRNEIPTVHVAGDTEGGTCHIDSSPPQRSPFQCSQRGAHAPPLSPHCCRRGMRFR